MFLAQRSNPASPSALGKMIIEEWIKERKKEAKT